MTNRFWFKVSSLLAVLLIAAVPLMAQWQVQTSGVTSDLRVVKTVNDTVVWAGGVGGVVLRTTNGGTTWEKKTIPQPTFDVYTLHALSATTAWIGATGSSGVDYRVFKTTDGGATWAQQVQYANSFSDGVRFYDANNGILVGDPDPASRFVVATTSDGGTTWNRVPIANLPAADSVKAEFGVTDNLGVWGTRAWFGTASDAANYVPRVYRSTDRGQTWTAGAPITGFTGGYTYGPALKDSNTIVFVGFGGKAAKSTDGGSTWAVVNVDTTVGLRFVDFVKGTTDTWVTGGGPSGTGVFYKTNNGGAAWTKIDLPAGTARLRSGAFASKTLGWVVGNGGKILKWTGMDISKSSVKVFFTANTATVPDTLPVTGAQIQIRGGVNHAGGFSPITWGNDAQNNMTSAGGDYWKKTLTMQVGDTLTYKYVVEFGSKTGWEQNTVAADPPARSSGNRSVIVPNKDTTLQVEFWNNGPSTREQYFRPWTAVADSFINVYFRVNMLGPMGTGAFNYNPGTASALGDTLAVRGGGPSGGDLNWSPSFYLTREAAASNSADAFTINPISMWSARVRIPKSQVTEGQSISYKFLIGYDWGRDELQGGAPNRTFKIPVGKKDTTLKWVFYNNDAPIQRANTDTVKITFQADLGQTIAAGGATVTDTVYVRTGYFTTAAESGRRKQMIRSAGTRFQATDTIVTSKGKTLDYQYYIMKNGVEVRENYYNFNFTGAIASEAERRQITVPSNASIANPMTVVDTSASITQARRQPLFPNTRKLARNVNVTWTVDMRPAIYQVDPAWGADSLTDVQNAFRTIKPTITDRDSILIWGVWGNGRAFGDWSNPGGGDWGLGLRANLLKKFYDNGTNGDKKAGDSVFTRQGFYGPDSTASTAGSKWQVGQVFKFGIYGGDNEGGRGGFGNNHNENINDAADTATIASQFGSINPTFFDAWNYDLKKPQKPTSVIDPNAPLVYRLEQNYPNPFNPTTKIEYSIPVQAQVELKVYNVVGQEVATLVSEVQKAGVHNVKFSATNFASGMYFYRITAGDFTSVKKMVLVK